MTEPLSREPYDNYVSEERLDVIEANEAKNVRDLSSLTTMRFRRLFNELVALRAHIQAMQETQSAEVVDLRAQLAEAQAALLREGIRSGEIERQLKEARAPMNKSLEDAAEFLWCVLANVSGGDWTKQSKEWQTAAAKARDDYFASIKPDNVEAP